MQVPMGGEKVLGLLVCDVNQLLEEFTPFVGSVVLIGLAEVKM